MKFTVSAAYYLLALLVCGVQADKEPLKDQSRLINLQSSRHHDVRLHCAHYPDWRIADEGDVLHFHSPHYPRLYPHSSRCGWQFKGKNEGIYFTINCQVFEMEAASGGKCKDYLSIKDESQQSQMFCGSQSPSLTIGNKVTMKFQSSYRKQAIGFTCTATAYLNTTWAANHPNIPDRCNADPANVDEVGAKGMTALMHNAKQRDIECVRALIQAKADVNLRSKTGVTALIMAARSGCDPCITLLTDAGANMALKDNRYGLTALMSACKNQQVGCVRNLLSANATVAYVDQKTQPEGVTALAYASGFSCPGCVQLLLDAGADPDNKDNWHKTALMAAARSDCTSCVEKLLEAKATTDIKNDEGRTALIYASRDGHPDSVRLLIQAGADVNITDREKHNALWHAQRWPCRPACIALLRAAGVTGPDVNPQYCAHEVYRKNL